MATVWHHLAESCDCCRNRRFSLLEPLEGWHEGAKVTSDVQLSGHSPYEIIQGRCGSHKVGEGLRA